MKPVVEMARMLLNAREGVVAANEAVQLGKRDPLSPVGRDYLTGVMEALAWVLDVDLHQMNAPKPIEHIEPSGLRADRVRVSYIDAYGCWFVEFPPDEMQAKQQERAEFLSPRQAMQLLDALRDHVLGRALLGPVEYHEYQARVQRDAHRVMPLAACVESGEHRPAAVVQLDAVRASRSVAGVAGESDLPEGA